MSRTETNICEILRTIYHHHHEHANDFRLIMVKQKPLGMGIMTCLELGGKLLSEIYKTYITYLCIYDVYICVYICTYIHSVVLFYQKESPPPPILSSRFEWQVATVSNTGKKKCIFDSNNIRHYYDTEDKEMIHFQTYIVWKTSYDEPHVSTCNVYKKERYKGLQDTNYP